MKKFLLIAPQTSFFSFFSKIMVYSNNFSFSKLPPTKSPLVLPKPPLNFYDQKGTTKKKYSLNCLADQINVYNKLLQEKSKISSQIITLKKEISYFSSLDSFFSLTPSDIFYGYSPLGKEIFYDYYSNKDWSYEISLLETKLNSFLSTENQLHQSLCFMTPGLIEYSFFYNQFSEIQNFFWISDKSIYCEFWTSLDFNQLKISFPEYVVQEISLTPLFFESPFFKPFYFIYSFFNITPPGERWDPILLTSSIFTFVFGYVISDIGYGLLFLPISLVYKNFPFLSMGLSSIFFGYLFNDFFGFHLFSKGYFHKHLFVDHFFCFCLMGILIQSIISLYRFYYSFLFFDFFQFSINFSLIIRCFFDFTPTLMDYYLLAFFILIFFYSKGFLAFKYIVSILSFSGFIRIPIMMGIKGYLISYFNYFLPFLPPVLIPIVGVLGHLVFCGYGLFSGTLLALRISGLDFLSKLNDVSGVRLFFKSYIYPTLLI